MMRRRLIALTSLFITTFALADPPAQTKHFASEKQKYAVDYPVTWRRINPQQMGGAELTLTPDKEPIYTRFSVMHNTADPGEKPPTKEELEQMLIGPLKSADPAAAVESDDETQLDREPARKLSITGLGPDGKPLVMHAVFCIRNRQSYLISIAGPTSASEQFLPSYEKIVDSFKFIK